MKKVLFSLVCAVLAFAAVAEPTRAERIRAKLDSNDRNYVFVTMHRGDWRHYPENSKDAILGAIAMGADVVELDVAPTKDGHYVLLHDGKLDRVANGKGKAKDLTLAEIKKYRLWSVDKNGNIDRTKVSKYEILTLEEAFALTKGNILVNLDKYPRDPKGITEVTIKCGVQKEIVFKSTIPKPQLRKQLGEALWARFESGELFYMPIVYTWQKDKCEPQFNEWQAGPKLPGAYEVCFKDEKNLTVIEKLGAMKAPCPRLWINTLWDSLCAGHTDERGHGGDAEGSWGWCLKHGATMIQTDRPVDCMKYLEKLGRRSLDK